MSGLSFTVSFFKTLSFLLLLADFFRGKDGHTSQHPHVLVGIRRLNIREIFWLSTLNFKDNPFNGGSHETLDRVHVKYVLPRGAFTKPMSPECEEGLGS